ncbi:MAG: 5-formyltetrahydrofolate cyclo-ligase [Clostridiales bacterium]|nr:5-formyltetrahydrofolate cyclo-ligase [Clostridiales bacterium]
MSMLPQEKAALRRLAAERIRGLSPEERKRASEIIAEQVFALPSWSRAKVVMAFVSTPSEPDTREILSRAVQQGKTVLLPRCLKAPEMEALPYRGEAFLRPGLWGIPEPVPLSGAEENRPPEPELILVPCVAATETGLRLGHGAGYYDWFLKNRKAETAGLCFRVQRMETLPVEPTDVALDRIIWG